MTSLQTIITNWCSCDVLKAKCQYKVRQLFYYKTAQLVLISGAGVKKGHFISQGGTVITKKGNFYHKLGQELQGKVIITKYGSTKLKCEK